MSSLDWEEIQALSFPERNLIALTHVSAILIYACAPFYHGRHNWRVGENEPTDSDWNEIERAIGRMEYEIMSGLVGAILPHAMADISSLMMLPCDGSAYLREDYPLLYEALDAVYIVDADNFTVPDLRDSFPLGEGIDFSLDDTGGTREETLTAAQMPAHTHDNAPHAHSEITAVPAVGAALIGVPIPSAIPGVGVTSFESISINPAGDDQPHNNMPPYRVVRWAIVAG